MKLRHRGAPIAAAFLLTAAAPGAPDAATVVAAPGAPDAATVGWVKAHAVALGAFESTLSSAEAAVVARIIAGARVIGLGEPFHGHEEPLAYRNRLIRHLVEHEGLTAVALESGLAETKRVGDYVAGGPGDATAVVRDNLSWRFNDLATNVELATWLHDWNRAHPQHAVRLYGIDVSGGDNKAEFGRSRASIDFIIAYLRRAQASRAATICASLSAFADRFSNSGYAGLGTADRTALHTALMEVRSLLRVERAQLVATTSADDFEWATRVAGDALDAERIFAVWPADPNQPMPGAAMVADIRDRAMAANTIWALEREGRHGRVLLFESSTHVTAAPMRPPGREGEAGTTAGQELRRILGGQYRVIVTASSLGRSADDSTIGSIDRVMVAAGRPRSLLGIRRSPDWWNQPQTLAHGGVRVNAVVPTQAFDGIIYVDAMQPARLIAKDAGQ